MGDPVILRQYWCTRTGFTGAKSARQGTRSAPVVAQLRKAVSRIATPVSRMQEEAQGSRVTKHPVQFEDSGPKTVNLFDFACKQVL